MEIKCADARHVIIVIRNTMLHYAALFGRFYVLMLLYSFAIIFLMPFSHLLLVFYFAP